MKYPKTASLHYLVKQLTLSQSEYRSVVGCVGRLAALWPLLGLGMEMIVLCVIIVAYEMGRNKRSLLDEDSANGQTQAADDGSAKAKLAAYVHVLLFSASPQIN